MPYDRSWMGYGIVGALETGAIALVVGILAYALLRAFGKGNGWSHGKELALAYVFAVVLSAGQDLWDLFYFNMAPLQSLTLLKLKLAAVHDPDAIGLRVFFEFVGALAGVCIGWAMFSGGLKKLFAGLRNP
ncbi:hypothetical protein ACQKIE_17865 [Luteibacter sp. NPDC031894]|jgi:hypothetical protein|uniref:hypothetical protein n=1 Tax=Luteibacter sp. NPDC031894 TaxID=3390572 RepID=UPI003D09027C